MTLDELIFHEWERHTFGTADCVDRGDFEAMARRLYVAGMMAAAGIAGRIAGVTAENEVIRAADAIEKGAK